MTSLVPATGEREIAITRQSSEALAETLGYMFLARQLPREETKVAPLISAAAVQLARAGLGENYDGVEYVYKRAGKEVRGPSVYFAREAARIWGHIHWGTRILSENDEQVICEAYAWDAQTGARPTAGFSIKKLIQRKQQDAYGDWSTQWIAPDARDLRELVNSIGARAVRNCILEIIPSWIVDSAVQGARQAMRAQAEADPGKYLAKLLKRFSEIGVSPENLSKILGHSPTLEQTTIDEMIRLQAIGKSISDGHAKASDFVQPDKPAAPEIDLSKFAPGLPPNIRKAELAIEGTQTLSDQELEAVKQADEHRHENHAPPQFDTFPDAAQYEDGVRIMVKGRLYELEADASAWREVKAAARRSAGSRRAI